jgi:hypothetical protein
VVRLDPCIYADNTNHYDKSEAWEKNNESKEKNKNMRKKKF